MRLMDVPVDKQYVVTSLGGSDEGAFCRLLAMGILPGAKLKLLRKEPLPVCQIGRSRLALDCSLAEKINVK